MKRPRATHQPSDERPEPWAVADAPMLRAARRLVRSAISRDTRFRLYFRMLDTPVVSEIYVFGRGRLRSRRIQPSTRLVIEAFPSSGSTYCRQAFLVANPGLGPDDICSHTHSPRVVQRAVRAGVPCVVVVRDPRDAVSSTVQRFGGIQVASAFAYYEHYYRRLLPLRERCVVAPFTAVIADVSSVIAQCNAKYGVSFETGTETGLSRDVIFQTMEERTRRKFGGDLREASISRPSDSRTTAAEFLADLAPHEVRAMQRALETYRAFIGDVPAAADSDTGAVPP